MTSISAVPVKRTSAVEKIEFQLSLVWHRPQSYVTTTCHGTTTRTALLNISVSLLGNFFFEMLSSVIDCGDITRDFYLNHR